MENERLKNAIDESELSRDDICDCVGISDGTLRNWCKGSVVPRTDLAISIAELLDSTVEELFG